MKPDRALEASQLIVNKHVTIDSGLPRDHLVRFLAEVLAWTGEIALVSRRRPEHVCERLLLESLDLMAVADLSREDRVVDIGSGAGFPGIVWATVRPEARFLLIERRERKAVFLERLVHVLALPHVEVLAGDASSAASRWPGQFSLAVAMAVGEPTTLMADVRDLLRQGGRFVCTVPAHADTPATAREFALVGRTRGQHGSYVSYRFGV